jgi:hypothetical protein
MPFEPSKRKNSLPFQRIPSKMSSLPTVSTLIAIHVVRIMHTFIASPRGNISSSSIKGSSNSSIIIIIISSSSTATHSSRAGSCGSPLAPTTALPAPAAAGGGRPPSRPPLVSEDSGRGVSVSLSRSVSLSLSLCVCLRVAIRNQVYLFIYYLSSLLRLAASSTLACTVLQQ